LICLHRIAQRNSNLVQLSCDHGGHVRSAVRVELHLRRSVYAPDELFRADRLGSNTAAFEASLRYPDRARGFVLSVVVMVVVTVRTTVVVVIAVDGFVTVVVMGRWVLTTAEQRRCD
jgi:Flp pilus assembly protein TadB